MINIAVVLSLILSLGFQDNIYDRNNLNGYFQIKTYYDGTPITEEKCDGVVYKKVGNNFYQKELQDNTINVKWYGAKGDGKNDDYEAIQKACTLPHNVYFPQGKYVIRKDYIKLKGGYKYFGDGKNLSYIIQRTKSDKYGFGGAGFFYVESSDEKNYIDGTQISKLGFDGCVSEYGHGQWTHLLALVGTNNTVVEDCGFYNFRGDGILVSGGLNYIDISKSLRHNKNLKIRNCSFDGGGTFLNRNGISFIDIDNALVENCDFKRIGHKNLVKSVGAIDFERDIEKSITKNVIISNCKFSDITQVNTAGITIMMRSEQPNQIENFTFKNNTFTNCFWGIFLGTKISKENLLSTHSDNIKILNNIFNYNNVALTIEGKKIEITGNNFSGKDEMKSSVKMGMFGVVSDCNLINNRFYNTGGLGCILIGSIYNTQFLENKFYKSRDYSIFFFNDDSQTPNKIIKNVKFTNNISEQTNIPFFYFGHNSNSKGKIDLKTIVESGNKNNNGDMYFGENLKFKKK